eukprot:CAMPEP_0174363948 /NCGR_PEP_ID=MMETSP0811_2-20130205/70900_1 /TAXON_ID=73025 ORGANISM="Eutreptiella gymnastica-like, Strain CCMP1594" /NCGR_SAMPLE_ID=MMETSP0811_2 /ASSEMBLY_ACC=CAM_ASM_000667 /LENGTH=123 /DNA_ID=CAMNT_0015503113 /DNA_START=381 /DNA_END=752 /DNA_ORIENTATION=+
MGSLVQAHDGFHLDVGALPLLVPPFLVPVLRPGFTPQSSLWAVLLPCFPGFPLPPPPLLSVPIANADGAPQRMCLSKVWSRRGVAAWPRTPSTSFSCTLSPQHLHRDHLRVTPSQEGLMDLLG